MCHVTSFNDALFFVASSITSSNHARGEIMGSPYRVKQTFGDSRFRRFQSCSNALTAAAVRITTRAVPFFVLSKSSCLRSKSTRSHSSAYNPTSHPRFEGQGELRLMDRTPLADDVADCCFLGVG